MRTIERKKVIKGLEVCLRNIDQQDCSNDCPYLSDCSKYENRVVFQPLMRDAFALLKEQEAVEPKRGLALTQKAWFCGACGFRLNRAGRFCSKCGQAVKWDERKRKTY